MVRKALINPGHCYSMQACLFLSLQRMNLFSYCSSGMRLIGYIFGNLLIAYPHYFIAFNIGQLEVDLVIHYFFAFV